MSRVLLVAILAAGSVLAPACRSDDINLGGLVIDETRTFAGQQFYKAFNALWQAYDPDSVYTLVIQERPSARTGSQITVVCYGKPMFQRFVSFNARKAADAGQDAAGTVFYAVQSAQLESMLGDPDFGSNEIE